MAGARTGGGDRSTRGSGELRREPVMTARAVGSGCLQQRGAGEMTLPCPLWFVKQGEKECLFLERILRDLVSHRESQFLATLGEAECG